VSPRPPGDGRDQVPDDSGRGPDHDPLVHDAQAAATRLRGLISAAVFVPLHAVVGYLTVSLGLVAPTWAVAALTAVWLVLAVVGWRQTRRRPIVAMLVPFVAAGLAIAVVSLGGAWLDWSA
jgi:hypothetical protein